MAQIDQSAMIPRLDRDAKVDDNGGVWCNTCFVSISVCYNPKSGVLMVLFSVHPAKDCLCRI